jgi:hypothetical protein
MRKKGVGSLLGYDLGETVADAAPVQCASHVPPKSDPGFYGHHFYTQRSHIQNIMQEAQQIDASREEAWGRNEIVDFRLKTAETQKVKVLTKAQKEAEVLQENLAWLLVPLSKMDALTIPLFMTNSMLILPQLLMRGTVTRRMRIWRKDHRIS